MDEFLQNESQITICDDGTYTTCFVNYLNKSEEEIKRVFNRFGEVYSVGRSDRLVFIRYKKREYLVNCVNSLKNDSYFKLRRAYKRRSEENSDTLETSFKDVPGNRTTRQLSSRNKNNRNKGPHQRYDKKHKYNTEKTKMFNNNQHNFHRTNNSKDNQTKCQEVTTELPPLIQIDQLSELNHKDLDLSSIRNEIIKISKPTIPTENIILIINMPNKMNFMDVVNLCKEFNPIHISLFESIKIKGEIVNYCQVYFNTKEDSNSACELLDGTNFHDKVLLVKNLLNGKLLFNLD